MYFGNMVYILEAPSTSFTTMSTTPATPTRRTTSTPTATITTTSAAKITRKVPVNNVVII